MSEKDVSTLTVDEVDEAIARARGWVTRRRDGDIGPIDTWEPGPSGVPALEEQWLRRDGGDGREILAWAPIYSQRWALAGPLLEEMAQCPTTILEALDDGTGARCDRLDRGRLTQSRGASLTEAIARAWLAWWRAKR